MLHKRRSRNYRDLLRIACIYAGKALPGDDFVYELIT